MSSIVEAIKRTYKWADAHDPTVYWAIDIHGTVLKPTYSDNGIATEFFPYAKEVLQMLSANTNNVLIMYTSSRPLTVNKYADFFSDNGITFKYWNSNPEVENKGHGYFTEKFYFNVMLEDKAGFDPEHDWQAILEFHEDEVL